MAIEFNGKKDVQNLQQIGSELPAKKKVKAEETETEKQVEIDNRFVKELGEELLTANLASQYGVKFGSRQGTKIDKEFWGDALDGLNLKDTAIAANTEKGIHNIINEFAIMDMEQKMKNSPFMKALNKEFGIE